MLSTVLMTNNLRHRLLSFIGSAGELHNVVYGSSISGFETFPCFI